jgi:hypothetical protein
MERTRRQYTLRRGESQGETGGKEFWRKRKIGKVYYGWTANDGNDWLEP